MKAISAAALAGALAAGLAATLLPGCAPGGRDETRGAPPAAAPIPARAAAAAPPPDGTDRVALENDRIRAHLLEYPPGARIPEHEHAHPRVVVVLAGGTLEIRDTGGTTATFEVRAGDVVWRPAEKHAIANPGATAVRLIEVDILDCR
jgi:quercetin dioxygenase-like cupin family protein